MDGMTDKATDKKSVKIIIAAHKECDLPRDEIYLPLFVGAAGHRGEEGFEIPAGFTPDDTGDNISDKNPYYCELTGLYWAWKNLDEDYIGLAHYRRLWGRKGSKEAPFERVLTREGFERLIDEHRDMKVIVPKKRRYFIESLASHYEHTHNKAHLKTARDIISERCPEYLDSCDRVFKQTWGYMFNMAIMDRDALDQYCRWLFPILDELPERTETADLSAFDARFPGRVAEILFNVWLDFSVNIGNISKRSIIEIDYFEAGSVNYLKKAGAFLRAKFTGRRYKNSF